VTSGRVSSKRFRQHQVCVSAGNMAKVMKRYFDCWREEA
jgi:hypothetical protein